MDVRLLNFAPNLRCPVSGQELKILTNEEIGRLNEAIDAGKLYTNEGEKIKVAIKEAFITKDGKYAYPVLEGKIAALLPSNALSTEQMNGFFKPDEHIHGLDKNKKVVQQFYDDFGWQKTAEGYKDTLTFEDRRKVSERYWSRCHLRLNKYLPGGKYLLDVASGSIPNDEYLTFCNRYEARICVDFSIQALKEAALRLKEKGIFILGDMTALPFKDNSIDSAISMHTVYHIPQQEQTTAVAEVYRVLKADGQAVIVYSWNKPVFMRIAFALWRPVIHLYKRLSRKRNAASMHPAASSSEKRPELFVQQQDYNWFKNQLESAYNARLGVYSAISRSFSNTFLKEKAFGRQLSSIIYKLENIFPSFMGKYGQYPVFLIKKERISSNSPLRNLAESPNERKIKKVVA